MLLVGAVASLDSGPVVWFELSSDADALSSQALSENAAAIPRTVAMALFLANETIVLSLTFFFSIFIFFPLSPRFRDALSLSNGVGISDALSLSNGVGITFKLPRQSSRRW